jgi:hypothetical protein
VSLRIDLTRDRARIFCAFVALACVTGAGSGARADAATHIDIGKNGIGAPPAEFDLLRRGENGQGKWTIVHDGTAMAGLAIEQSGVEATEDRFPLAISKTAPLKNAAISLRLKATGGTSDRDGGIAVRLKTPDDYYLVQLDALRDRVLFSLVTNGVPEEIVGVDADISRTRGTRWQSGPRTTNSSSRSTGFGCSPGSTRPCLRQDVSRFGPRATASRGLTRSRSHRCHEFAMTQSSAAFTICGAVNIRRFR